jgi:hypothetical protein
MAQHIRHTDREKNERAIVKFRREDLLWRGRIADIDVPLQDRERVVGPTILDMLMRHETVVDEEAVVYWSLREAKSFMEPDRKKRAGALHPFRAGLVSGGQVLDTGSDFVRVAKQSSVSIGVYAFRLAVAALGSVNDAHNAISTRAAAAWAADLVRSRALYDAIKAAPDGVLIEDATTAALRPAGSVSEQIETDILREACVLLGVDPDLPIKRPQGRPWPSRQGDTDTEAGDFISVTVTDGVVSAKTLASIAGIPAHTDLAVLTVLKLVALLHTLVQGDAQLDADLLEAYLDAAAPQWRETTSGEDATDSSASTADPYSILGVTPDMTFEDITKAYRRAMQAMHPDKGACPPWFAQMAGHAYRQIKAEMARSNEE